MHPLVTTDWLAERIGEPEVRVVDVRWYLDPTRSGRAAWEAGHLPGAVFLDIDADLSAPGGARGGPLGRHPWPPEAQLREVMSRAGVGAGTTVVAYDDAAGGVAARLWWLLRAHGHDAVAVLDGGLTRWLAEDRPLETGTVAVPTARFEGALLPGFVVTKAELLEELPGALVLDARVAERYRGETEPIDPRAGHIPGALSAPLADNLTQEAVPVFRGGSELRRRYAALGADGREPILYCGSGVNACHSLLALELAGLRGRLYAGSWSEWSSDPALPVEVGEPDA
jgi:thiosulfate/3-mercaptopyruvate sulfurtransferase